MSISHDIVYACPYCGKEFAMTVQDSVNASQDPDLRDRCLSGDIFKQTCPHCQADFMAMTPIVYSDPEHRFVLWLSDKELPEAVKKQADVLVKAGYRLRRCLDIQEFTEKIQIFEDGVDDVLVEIAKYDSFIEFIDNRKGNPEDVTSIEYQSTRNDVMKINIRTGDKGMSFHIPVNLLAEEIKAEKDLYAINDRDIPVVNSQWVISLFNEPAGQA